MAKSQAFLWAKRARGFTANHSLLSGAPSPRETHACAAGAGWLSLGEWVLVVLRDICMCRRPVECICRFHLFNNSSQNVSSRSFPRPLRTKCQGAHAALGPPLGLALYTCPRAATRAGGAEQCDGPGLRGLSDGSGPRQRPLRRLLGGDARRRGGPGASRIAWMR